MADILIIDDDPVICDVLVQMMRRISHESRYALSGAHGLELAKNGLFDIVFLDINLPDANGLDLIQKIKILPSSPEIIIITGESDPDGAELAISSGAWNYLEKPFLRQEIALQVKRALEYRREKGRVSSPGQLKRNEIIGESDVLENCLEQVSVAAYSDVPVLLAGEAGSGKALFAKTVHLNSDRRDGNFVIVDCSAMNADIAESLLYGVTSAQDQTQKSGAIAKANGGTLLLDEVGRLPMEGQKALLRAMEDMAFTPVGGAHSLKSDFRVIATTRDDISALAEAGTFRNDLLFALDGVQIQTPPLRELKQDIVRLAIHYMERCCKKYQIETKGVSPEFLGILSEYPWPGNVRELINAMDKAVASARHEPILYSIHLPGYVKDAIINKADPETATAFPPLPSLDFSQAGHLSKLKDVMAHVEKQYLLRLWKETQENINLACEISGVSRSSLYERLKRHNIR